MIHKKSTYRELYEATDREKKGNTCLYLLWFIYFVCILFVLFCFIYHHNHSYFIVYISYIDFIRVWSHGGGVTWQVCGRKWHILLWHAQLIICDHKLRHTVVLHSLNYFLVPLLDCSSCVVHSIFTTFNTNLLDSLEAESFSKAGIDGWGRIFTPEAWTQVDWLLSYQTAGWKGSADR